MYRWFVNMSGNVLCTMESRFLEPSISRTSRSVSNQFSFPLEVRENGILLFFITYTKQLLSCRLHNDVPLNQATNTLRLSSLSTANGGLYKCRASNEYGKAVSNEAKLTVIAGKIYIPERALS